MKYVVIQRGITSAEWMIRILESGDTEILERTEQYSDAFVINPFTVNGTSYFWTEWASKDLWKEVWIDDSQGNGPDTTLTYFEDFDEAFDFLENL